MGPRPGNLKERMRTRNTEMASKEGGGGHVCDWQDSILIKYASLWIDRCTRGESSVLADHRVVRDSQT